MCLHYLCLFQTCACSAIRDGSGHGERKKRKGRKDLAGSESTTSMKQGRGTTAWARTPTQDPHSLSMDFSFDYCFISLIPSSLLHTSLITSSFVYTQGDQGPMRDVLPMLLSPGRFAARAKGAIAEVRGPTALPTGSAELHVSQVLQQECSGLGPPRACQANPPLHGCLLVGPLTCGHRRPARQQGHSPLMVNLPHLGPCHAPPPLQAWPMAFGSASTVEFLTFQDGIIMILMTKPHHTVACAAHSSLQAWPADFGSASMVDFFRWLQTAYDLPQRQAIVVCVVCVCGVCGVLYVRCGCIGTVHEWVWCLGMVWCVVCIKQAIQTRIVLVGSKLRGADTMV